VGVNFLGTLARHLKVSRRAVENFECAVESMDSILIETKLHDTS